MNRHQRRSQAARDRSSGTDVDALMQRFFLLAWRLDVNKSLFASTMKSDPAAMTRAFVRHGMTGIELQRVSQALAEDAFERARKVIDLGQRAAACTDEAERRALLAEVFAERETRWDQQ